MTNGHPTREEDFDLYALGALEGEEKQAIESHVAGCAQCARRLAEARGRMAMLSFAAPRAEAPARVKAQLIDVIRAERESMARHSASRSVHRHSTSRGGGNFVRWLVPVLAPVAIALAVATVFLWRQNDRLERALGNQTRMVISVQKQLEDSQHVAELLAARDTIVVPLMPMPGQSKGMGRVTYNKGMGMLMYDGTLVPAPADKSYQLWLVPTKGAPINAGVFNPKAGEPDHWMMQLPQGLTPKAFAVTLEPAGGMPHPTGPKVLAGTAS